MEKLLADHPDDPTLLLTLGRLSLRAQLWGKARGYLEACIGRNGPAQAYRELGQLLERCMSRSKAIEVYRRGLSGAGGPGARCPAARHRQDQGQPADARRPTRSPTHPGCPARRRRTLVNLSQGRLSVSRLGARILGVVERVVVHLLIRHAGGAEGFARRH